MRLGGLSQAAYSREIELAARQFERASQEADKASSGVEGLDQALKGLQTELEGVGRETADYLAKAALGIDGVRFSFDQLAAKLASGVLSRLIFDEITGPLSRALVQMARLGIQGLGRLFSATASQAASTSSVAVSAYGQTANLGPAFHTGGVVGADFPALRRISTDMIRSAQRFHSGTSPLLLPDEQAAILRKGEVVLTAAQARAMGPAGGSTTVNVIDQRGAGAPAAEVTEAPDGQGGLRIDVLIKAEVNRGISDGSFDRSLRNSFGIARRGA